MKWAHENAGCVLREDGAYAVIRAPHEGFERPGERIAYTLVRYPEPLRIGASDRGRKPGELVATSICENTPEGRNAAWRSLMEKCDA